MNNTEKKDEYQSLFAAQEELNKHIKFIEMENSHKHIFLSKCKWAREGEKPTSYFLALQKRKYLAKNMKSFKTDKGIVVKQQKEILNEQRKFYETLYSYDSHVRFTCQNNGKYPALSKEQADRLELPITEKEMLANLNDMGSNKVPGMNGLPKEFYVTFFTKLKPYLLALSDEILESKELNESAQKGVIALLPKPNKDRLFLKSWHPLTMLNTDYKLLAKILAERMKNVLPTIISEEQTGFMAGRDICENLRKTMETIEFANHKNKAGIIISIDFEKCFDRVSHKSVLAALCFFGFGNHYVDWVSVFFKNFTICTQNFGFISDLFDKKKSVNQGCPISPHCYLAIGQLIALKIKESRQIKGYKISDQIRNILSQFADDTALFLEFDAISLEKMLEIFKNIEANTGLKISYDKTVIYRIGSIQNTEVKLYTQKNLNWTNESFKLLEIEMSNDKQMSQINYKKNYR